MMPEIFMQYKEEIIQAIGETFLMVGASVVAAVLIGLPMGTILYVWTNCRKSTSIWSR